MVTGYNRQSPGHSVPGLPDPPRVRARGVYDAYERLVTRYLEPTLRKDEFVAPTGINTRRRIRTLLPAIDPNGVEGRRRTVEPEVVRDLDR